MTSLILIDPKEHFGSSIKERVALLPHFSLNPTIHGPAMSCALYFKWPTLKGSHRSSNRKTCNFPSLRYSSPTNHNPHVFVFSTVHMCRRTMGKVGHVCHDPAGTMGTIMHKSDGHSIMPSLGLLIVFDAFLQVDQAWITPHIFLYPSIIQQPPLIAHLKKW